ncbi:MAG: single-stranded-DNA-specific exonuclease RecJ [Chloroflexi bacterium]|nr:single-stranded-DNA-specific exonuclease RecJ [Chloroflexota bacterium]
MTSPLVPAFAWTVPVAHPVTDATIADARRRGLSARLIRVLSRRGMVDPVSLAARFDAPDTALHDPWLLPDADRAVARIRRAIEQRERVLVLGDFDADGLTGLAVLVLALRHLGLDTEPYVPDRSDEGHGLSMGAIETAAAEGRTLILTADTGSTSHAEIAAASTRGIEVIVTDHHQLHGGLPDAVAVVNPQRADSRYPDRRLSGSGVAFKVAQLLLADRPGGPELALTFADLAAIGSIADVVPMDGENRAIARLGLTRLASGTRPGLAALLTSAGVAPERVSPETVSFALAPRINALGRVGHALDAARLLLADDTAEIERLVTVIEAANLERRALMNAALEEARAALGPDDGAPVLVVAGPWAPGVVGLVAGRLADRMGRPAVVFSTLVDPWRGSARSAAGFDLAAAFSANAELFERFGGHAAAAGCHLRAERIDAFRVAMTRAVTEARPEGPARPTLALDLAVSAGSVDHVLLAELRPLDGAGDEPPLLGITGLTVTRVRAATGGHTQLTLRRGMDVLDGICFGRTDLVDMVHEGDAVDVAGRLRSRRFQGLETLQIEVEDVAPAGHLRAIWRERDAAPVTISTPVAVA